MVDKQGKHKLFKCMQTRKIMLLIMYISVRKILRIPCIDQILFLSGKKCIAIWFYPSQNLVTLKHNSIQIYKRQQRNPLCLFEED